MDCKYCGKPLVDMYDKYQRLTCGGCSFKKRLLPNFVKARDDLREQLGMERMGANNGRKNKIVHSVRE